MLQFYNESVTVTVTARNVVGASNSFVSRKIGELLTAFLAILVSHFMVVNTFSTGGTYADLEVCVDSANPVNSSVECIFEPGYTCTIEYGTDPSYTNLPYVDNSTTVGQVATINLSLELRRDTTYYYIVSAKSGSRCVGVRGTFRTGGWTYIMREIGSKY